MDHGKMNVCKLHPLASFAPDDEVYSRHDGMTIMKATENPMFPVSHHATIYRRAWLIDNLRSAIAGGAHTPWQHELWCQKEHNLFRKSFQIETRKVELITVVTKGKVVTAGCKFIAGSTWDECKQLGEYIKEALLLEPQGTNMDGLDDAARAELVIALPALERIQTLLMLKPKAAAILIELMSDAMRKQVLKDLPVKFEGSVMDRFSIPLYYNVRGVLCAQYPGYERDLYLAMRGPIT